MLSRYHTVKKLENMKLLFKSHALSLTSKEPNRKGKPKNSFKR